MFVNNVAIKSTDLFLQFEEEKIIKLSTLAMPSFPPILYWHQNAPSEKISPFLVNFHKVGLVRCQDKVCSFYSKRIF